MTWYSTRLEKLLKKAYGQKPSGAAIAEVLPTVQPIIELEPREDHPELWVPSEFYPGLFGSAVGAVAQFAGFALVNPTNSSRIVVVTAVRAGASAAGIAMRTAVLTGIAGAGATRATDSRIRTNAGTVSTVSQNTSYTNAAAQYGAYVENSVVFVSQNSMGDLVPPSTKIVLLPGAACTAESNAAFTGNIACEFAFYERDLHSTSESSSR